MIFLNENNFLTLRCHIFSGSGFLTFRSNSLGNPDIAGIGIGISKSQKKTSEKSQNPEDWNRDLKISKKSRVQNPKKSQNPKIKGIGIHFSRYFEIFENYEKQLFKKRRLHSKF